MIKKKASIIFLTAIFILQSFVFRNASGAALLDRVVAVVNNEVITWSELRELISIEGKDFLQKVPEDRKEEAIKAVEKDFLNNLIDIKLQLQEARKKGIDVSSGEINSAIADIKKKYNLTDEALLNSLTAEGMTMNDYRTRLSEQILLSKVVNFEVKVNIIIPDDAISKYYDTNRDKFEGKEKRKIRQILFRLPKDNSQKPAIEAKADEMVRRLQGGEDFSKLAGELSEDASKQFGGDIGYISRGSALKEIEEAAFSLNVGEVSRPFWSPAGLHIIKVEDKIEGGGFDKVKDKIKEALFEKAFEVKYTEWKAGLKEKAYIEIKL